MDKDDERLYEEMIEVICGDKMIGAMAALHSLKKDAERYRWLKANHLQTGPDSWIRTGDDLEEAIDEAMRKPKP